MVRFGRKCAVPADNRGGAIGAPCGFRVVSRDDRVVVVVVIAGLVSLRTFRFSE